MSISQLISLLVSNTLMYSAPLIFAALAGVISEKSGVVTLGIEGVMNIGAIMGVVFGYYTKNPWLGFIGGGLAGALLMSLHAVASVSLRANQTISGTAINLIGPALSIFLCKVFFDGSIISATVPKTLPRLLNFLRTNPNPAISSFNIDSTWAMAIVATFIVWFLLYKTKYGLRIISVGEQPAAADSLGINVKTVRYVSVIIGGFLAGLGGAACTLRIVDSFNPTIIAGKGFIALAAVIFGKWKPQNAMGACILFGFAQALVVAVGGSKLTIPTSLISMLPYVLTMAILILFVGKSESPAASGQFFEKGKR